MKMDAWTEGHSTVPFPQCCFEDVTWSLDLEGKFTLPFFKSRWERLVLCQPFSGICFFHLCFWLGCIIKHMPTYPRMTWRPTSKTVAFYGLKTSLERCSTKKDQVGKGRPKHQTLYDAWGKSGLKTPVFFIEVVEVVGVFPENRETKTWWGEVLKGITLETCRGSLYTFLYKKHVQRYFMFIYVDLDAVVGNQKKNRNLCMLWGCLLWGVAPRKDLR